MRTTPLHTTPERSALMRRVKRHGTAPELTVRRLLYRMGARYRIGVRSLPGSPDIANKQKKRAIFVHGCFWHAHQDCPKATLPTRNRSFWQEKFTANRDRDARKVAALVLLGYDILTIWECELSDTQSVTTRLQSFWFNSFTTATRRRNDRIS